MLGFASWEDVVRIPASTVVVGGPFRVIRTSGTAQLLASADFVPFDIVVSTSDAQYQPMVLPRRAAQPAQGATPFRCARLNLHGDASERARRLTTVQPLLEWRGQAAQSMT